MEKMPPNFVNILKEHLLKYNISPHEPEPITEVKWFPKISLETQFGYGVPNIYKSSGIYRIYFDGKIVYIGSSDSDGRLPGKRAGMWGRRADFKSSLYNSTIKNGRPQTYSNIPQQISKLFYKGKKFPMKDCYKFEHEFFPCHPDQVRDIEETIQKEYKDIHGDVPLFNKVENFVGGARKIL